MWKYISILAIAGCFACENKQSKESQEKAAVVDTTLVAKIQFEQPDVTLPNITEGDTLFHRFKFKNAGSASLTIRNASASCGCTLPSVPKNAIAPNDTASILVKFNSKNKVGKNSKTVTVYANTQPEMSTVSFKVEVIEKKK